MKKIVISHCRECQYRLPKWDVCTNIGDTIQDFPSTPSKGILEDCPLEDDMTPEKPKIEWKAVAHDGFRANLDIDNISYTLRVYQIADYFWRATVYDIPQSFSWISADNSPAKTEQEAKAQAEAALWKYLQLKNQTP